MADWYVDFTLDTNGSGTTYSGAWNQFTATEAATVSGGDSIWFRRCDPGNGAKIITIKEGDSSGSIKYIGWPKEGDILYDSRPVDPRSTWDSDGAEYVYQTLNSRYGAVHSLKSNNKFYRWHFYNTGTDYWNPDSKQRTIDILSKNNIRLYNCYLDIYETGDGFIYTADLRVESSFDILFSKCIIYQEQGRSYSSFKLWYLYNSSIKFKECDFYVPDYTYGNYNYQNLDSRSSNIKSCSLVEFDHCTFHNRFAITYTGASTTVNRICHINGSIVNFNNCTIKHENNTNYTNDPLRKEPFTWFLVDGGSTINLNNCEYNSVATMSSMMFVNSSSEKIICSGLEVNIDTNRNIVFSVNSVAKLAINGLTGAINKYDGVDNANYLMAWRDRSRMFSDYVTISGINCYPGDILERYNTTGVDINLTNEDKYEKFRVYFGSFANFTCDNCKFGGLGFYHASYSTSRSWYGCSYDYRTINIKNTEIAGSECLYLGSTYYPKYLDATIYRCTGDGNYPILNDNYPASVKSNIKLIRNKNFNGHGASCKQNTTYSCLFNNRDLKVYDYNYCGHTETSTVYRQGSVEYSIKLVHSSVGMGDLVYSPIGNEKIWFRLSTKGSYNIIAYLLYRCSSCNLTISDIYFEANYFDSLGDSYLVDMPSLLADTDSTWSISGNKIKLVSSITVTDAQYCPIRFILSKYYDGLEVYLDPKIDVILQ